jgi:hypothetical protein
MRTKPNKYQYLNVVQGYYAPHGWEDLTASTDYKEARADLRAYRVNDPTTAHRLIKRRELNLPSLVKEQAI